MIALEYDGYTITFEISQKIHSTLERQGVNVKQLLEDHWLWFEEILLEVVDEYQASSKDFVITLYGASSPEEQAEMPIEKIKYLCSDEHDLKKCVLKYAIRVK